MIAYFHTRSPKSKSYRSLSNEFVLRALGTPFARGIIAYANETCPSFNGTVAEWCKQRLQVAKEIFRTTERDPLSSDATVKDLCHALHIISWSKHSTRNCAHMALCDRASQVVVHGIAKLAQMPCSEAHVQELAHKLDEQMDLFIKRRKSMIFTELEDWEHSPAKGLQRLIDEVKQSVANE